MEKRTGINGERKRIKAKRKGINESPGKTGKFLWASSFSYAINARNSKSHEKRDRQKAGQNIWKDCGVIEVKVQSQTTVACPVVRVDGLDLIFYAF